MSTELLAEGVRVANPLALLDKAISSGIDPDKLGKLMDLAERWQANQAAAEWASSVTRFQGLMPAIEEKKGIPDKQGKIKYHYAPLEDIMEIAQPLLTECGIAVSYDSKPHTDKIMSYTCNVSVGTHTKSTTVYLGLPEIPLANDSQKAGGALEYGRRYSLIAALNLRIKGMDDDAQSQTNSDLVTPDDIIFLDRTIGDAVKCGAIKDKDAFLKWVREKCKANDLDELTLKAFNEGMAELKSRIAKKGGAA